MTDAEEPGALTDLIAAREAYEHAREDLRDAVREARREGHSWAEIGRAFRITRQAAWERFRGVV